MAELLQPPQFCYKALLGSEPRHEDGSRNSRVSQPLRGKTVKLAPLGLR